MTLSSQAILRRAPDLHIRLRSNEEMQVTIGAREVLCGVYGLTLLDLFARPMSVGAALGVLRSRLKGAEEFKALTTTLLSLYRSGALLSDSPVTSSLPVSSWGFDNLKVHVRMLNDRTRVESYLAALAEAVRPGDVVVEIGTGTGVLSVAAARAGARRVYAIEVGRIGRTAQAIFKANEVADKVTLLEGWSTQISLPEPANVLVSEIIGNDPLAERVLEATADAVKRFLAPDARLIPRGLKIYGLPVTIPAEALRRETVQTETLLEWKGRHQIDFSPLAAAARTQDIKLSVEPQAVRDWPMLGDPVLLADIDFCIVHDLVIDRRMSFYAASDGTLNGLLIYFDLELGHGRRLSTSPAKAAPDCHWRNQVWVLPEAMRVRVGDQVGVHFQHGIVATDQIRLFSINGCGH